MKQKTVRLTPKMARALITFLEDDSLDWDGAIRDFDAAKDRISRFVDEVYLTPKSGKP